MLEQVADDDHVEAAFELRQVGMVEVELDHAVEKLRGGGGGIGHQLHAPPAHARVQLLEAASQAAVGAAEFEHALRVGRNRVQQLEVEAVVVVAHAASHWVERIPFGLSD